MKTNKFQLPELTKRKIKAVYAEEIGYRKEGLRVEHQMVQGKHVIHNYGQGQSEIELCYGSAFIAIKSMMIKIDNNSAHNIAILGSNINSLITAIQLIKRGFKITLYSSEEFKLKNMSQSLQKSAPKGYTLWFPDGYDWEEDLLKHELFSKYSYDFLQQCIRYHRYRSVHEASVVEFNKTIEELREVVSDLVFDNYRHITLDYGNGQHQQVVTYNTVIVDNALFEEQLKTELVLRGGKFVTKGFTTLNDVMALKEEIVVNCLGPALTKSIFPDELLMVKELLVVDLETELLEKGRELNVRLHLEEGQNYEIVQRNGNLKIKLPQKSDPKQTNLQYAQRHLFKLDAFFKTRRSQTAKL